MARTWTKCIIWHLPSSSCFSPRLWPIMCVIIVASCWGSNTLDTCNYNQKIRKLTHLIIIRKLYHSRVIGVSILSLFLWFSNWTLRLLCSIFLFFILLTSIIIIRKSHYLTHVIIIRKSHHWTPVIIIRISHHWTPVIIIRISHHLTPVIIIRKS